MFHIFNLNNKYDFTFSTVATVFSRGLYITLCYLMLQVKLFNHKCRFEVHKLLFKDVSLKNHLPKVNFLCRQDKNALELISFLSLIRLRYQKERERSVCMCMCTACVCMWWGSRSVCVVCPISLAYMLCNFC